ncbi:MAG: hypothetical protein U5K81_07055 [Trueperaceae bacterium]|nr:hypothetical protein [Trueperaceae bacterium]
MSAAETSQAVATAWSIRIDSDVLYPEREQRELVELLPRARCATLRSPHGHDAFLIEFPQVAAQLRRFLNEVA